MIKPLAQLYLVVLFLINGLYADTKSDIEPISKISLTQKEKSYLKEKKKIKVCTYADRMPYVGHDEDHIYGIIVDYYKAFEKRIGIPLEIVHLSHLNECVRSVAEGKTDVVSAVSTPNTFSELILSSEYGNDFITLVTKLETPFIGDVKLLKGKSIGIIGNYKNMIAYLQQTYPSLQFTVTDSTKDGLEKVANGSLYAFLDIHRIAAYRIQREYVGELKVNTKVSPLIIKAHVGIRKNETILRDIFNKAISDISRGEKIKMIDHWMRAKEVVKADYRLIVEIIVLAFLILFGFIFYHLRVRHQQKITLEKQAKLASMGSMINSIAHQWRQPLSRINSNITVMKSLLESEEEEKKLLEQKLDSIEENTQYMSDTIEDFMNFFHPDKQKRSFLLHESIEKALHLTGIESKNIEVSLKSDEDIWLYTYEKELTQVILIILGNAIDNFKIKSIDDPKIEITLKRVNSKVLLTIQDNGGGVEEKDIERIFEPYYTTKFKHEGTGLGLYMAKLLIENSMGGELRVKNSKNGAQFMLELPVNREDNSDG